jgi:hypothetical protein
MTANREREVHIRGSSKTETYPEPGSSVPTNDRFLSGLPRQLGNHLTWVVGDKDKNFALWHHRWLRKDNARGKNRSRRHKLLKLPSKIAHEGARKKFVTLLREFVDDWITTGVTREGIEIPGSRSFLVPHKRYKFKAERVLKMGERIFREGGPTIQFPLSRPYYTVDGFGSFHPCANVWKHAKQEAERYMIWFFAVGDLKFRIVKCRKRECGRYDLIKRRNPLSTDKDGNYTVIYKRGNYCRAHNPSAKVVTEERREKKKDLLLNLAKVGLKKWHAYQPFSRSKNRMQNYVVRFINSNIPPDLAKISPLTPITGKWLTRNRKDISARLERENSEWA